MNTLKVLALVAAIMFSSVAWAVAPIKLCLTGKIELILPNYRPAFLNAVDLALSHHDAMKNIHTKTYFFDNKPLSALKAYREMLDDKCSAIIGFEYLSDLLLVVGQQRDSRVPIFTSYASTNDNEKLPDNIFIFSPTYDFLAARMIEFLREKYQHIENVLIITEVDRADLLKYREAYENIFHKENIKYTRLDLIGNDVSLENKLSVAASGRNYNFVIVLFDAVGSTRILNYSNEE